MTIGPSSKNCRAAAFDQHLQLFFCILTCRNLAFSLPHVLACRAPAAHDTIDEEAEPAECGEGEDVSWDADGRRPFQAVKSLGKSGAENGRNTNLPSIQDSADEQHGEQIEKSKRNLSIDAPIRNRYQGHQQACAP